MTERDTVIGAGAGSERSEGAIGGIADALRRAKPGELAALAELIAEKPGSSFLSEIRRGVLDLASSRRGEAATLPLGLADAGSGESGVVQRPSEAREVREAKDQIGQKERIAFIYTKALGRPVTMESNGSEIEEMDKSLTELSGVTDRHRSRLRQKPTIESLDRETVLPFGKAERSQSYVLDFIPEDEKQKKLLARSMAAQFLASGIPLKSQDMMREVLTGNQESSDPVKFGESRVGVQIALMSSFPREIATRIKLLLDTIPEQTVEENPDPSASFNAQFESDRKLLKDRFDNQPIPGFPGCDGEFIADVIRNASEIMWQKAIYSQEQIFDRDIRELQRRARENARDFAGTITSPVGQPDQIKNLNDFPPLDKVQTDTEDGQLLQTALGMDIVSYLKRKKHDKPVDSIADEYFANIQFEKLGIYGLTADSEKAGNRQILDSYQLTREGIADTQSDEHLDVKVTTGGKVETKWPQELIISLKSDAGRPMAAGTPIQDKQTKDTISDYVIRLSETVGLREAVRSIGQLSEQAGLDKKVNLFAVTAKDLFDKYKADNSDNGKRRKLHAVWALTRSAMDYQSDYVSQEGNITQYDLVIPLLESPDAGPFLTDLVIFSGIENPNTGDSKSGFRGVVENRDKMMLSFFDAFDRQLDRPTISQEELHTQIKRFGERSFGMVKFLAEHNQFADSRDNETRQAYITMTNWFMRYCEIRLKSREKLGGQDSGGAGSFADEFGFKSEEIVQITSSINDESLKKRFEKIKKASAN